MGLSIAEGLTFQQSPTKPELMEVAETIISHYTREDIKVYIQTLCEIFKAAECVICLEGIPADISVVIMNVLPL